MPEQPAMESVNPTAQVNKHPLVHEVTWNELKERVSRLPKGVCYGIPRGGSVIAAMTSSPVHTIAEADFIVDDVYDSGRTSEEYKKYGKEIFFVYDKRHEFQKTWLKFPWEENKEKDLQHHVVRLLEGIGENPKREGLLETPERFVKFFTNFVQKPKFNFTTFANEGIDEMIIQSNIPFFSLCEHHLVPFFGTGTIAYIPDTKIVGLSKLARSLDYFSHSLQNQERITKEVADLINYQLKPKGVAVLLRARHLCMEMRGVKKHDVLTTTSCLTGAFKDDIICRNEFLKLA